MSEKQKANLVLAVHGRSKLVGTNVFSLVYDNSNVRLLSSKLKKNNKNDIINDIKLDMISNPYNYIDPFSTVKSIMEFDRRRSNDCCFADIYEYFACNKDGEEYKSFLKATKCGLWLIGNAEFVFDVYGKPIPCKTSEDEYADFWNKVYQKIKDDNNFIDRNKNYLYQLSLKNEKLSLIKRIKNGTVNIFEESKKNVEKLLNIPTGIVDLDGEFFPCNFGEHEFLAKKICNKYNLNLN